MQWIEVTVNTDTYSIDTLCDALQDLGVEGLVREDETELLMFFENNRKYWDYVDEELVESIRGVSRVKFYLEDSGPGKAEYLRLRAALPEEKFITRSIRNEDWENNWKEYYKPVPVGDRLLIVPEWEQVEAGNREILRLDPGLIFGTGEHATTKMCLRLLEKYAKRGRTVLDLGCGSGILAIAALVLGADKAVGCDIDPKAPKVAVENAALNDIGADRFAVYAGDIITDERLQKKLEKRKYDIILANIVADVIISLAPSAKAYLADGGVFVCSGIIDGREDDVKTALVEAGFIIIGEYSEDCWHCFECRSNGPEGK